MHTDAQREREKKRGARDANNVSGRRSGGRGRGGGAERKEEIGLDRPTTGMRIMRPREVRVARRMRQVRVRMRVRRHRERVALAVHLHFRSEATTHYLEHRVAIHLSARVAALATVLSEAANPFLRSSGACCHVTAPTILLPLLLLFLVLLLVLVLLV